MAQTQHCECAQSKINMLRNRKQYKVSSLSNGSVDCSSNAVPDRCERCAPEVQRAETTHTNVLLVLLTATAERKNAVRGDSRT